MWRNLEHLQQITRKLPLQVVIGALPINLLEFSCLLLLQITKKTHHQYLAWHMSPTYQWLLSPSLMCTKDSGRALSGTARPACGKVGRGARRRSTMQAGHGLLAIDETYGVNFLFVRYRQRGWDYRKRCISPFIKGNFGFFFCDHQILGGERGSVEVLGHL